MLKEAHKLTQEAVTQLSGDTAEVEARVIKAKSIRFGVDPQWVKQRMLETFRDDPVVRGYQGRMREIIDGVYQKVDLTGVKLLDESLPECMTMEVFLQVQEAGLKASVEVFKESAQKLRKSLGGEIPGDWKDRLSKDINNVNFMRSLNEQVNKAQQAKLQEHGFSVIKDID